LPLPQDRLNDYPHVKFLRNFVNKLALRPPMQKAASQMFWKPLDFADAKPITRGD
jgi:hypothetical protein